MYKAAALVSPQRISIEKREEPRVGKSEVLIRVKFAGVCGTDVSLFSGEYKVPLPIVIGHEFSGEVIEVGTEVEEELVGKRVVGEINNTCLAYRKEELCEFCKRGLSNHCSKRTVLGIISYDGAFSELIRIPAGSVHILPPEISMEEAVFIEPLAAAIQAFELAPVNKGDTVAVVGAGRLGTLVCAVAKTLGARVIAVSRSNWKLERAEKFGASGVINSSVEDPVKRIRDMTDGMGADVIVESSGTPQGLNVALELVRPRGTVTLKTTCGLANEGINYTRAVVDEIRIQGSRCGPFDKAIEMLSAWEIPVRSLISHIYHLEQVEEAIITANTVSKVIIDLDSKG